MKTIHKKKIFLFAVLVLLIGNVGKACLQHLGEPFVSRYKESQKTFPVPKGHQVEHLEHGPYFWGDLRADFKAGRYEGSIDLGVLLVYKKEYAEAESTFAKIIQKWPDKYEACANYGTILEVNGKLQDALHWLQKAIKINPSSHEGTEWLHLKILEAKIAQMNPVKGSALTGQDFGEGQVPRAVVDSFKTRALQHALFYQLNERMTFIQPEDPYIAALLFELGNVCLLFNDKRSARENYEAAERYGFHSKLLDQRKWLTISKQPLTMTFPVATLAADTAASAAPTSQTHQPDPKETPKHTDTDQDILAKEDPLQNWFIIIAGSAFILALFAIVLVMRYMRRNKH